MANQADRCSTTDLQQNLTPVRDQLGNMMQQSTSTLVESSGLAASGEATTSRCSYSNTAAHPHASEHLLRPALCGTKLQPAGVTKPIEDPTYPQRNIKRDASRGEDDLAIKELRDLEDAACMAGM